MISRSRDVEVLEAGPGEEGGQRTRALKPARDSERGPRPRSLGSRRRASSSACGFSAPSSRPRAPSLAARRDSPREPASCSMSCRRQCARRPSRVQRPRGVRSPTPVRAARVCGSTPRAPRGRRRRRGRLRIRLRRFPAQRAPADAPACPLLARTIAAAFDDGAPRPASARRTGGSSPAPRRRHRRHLSARRDPPVVRSVVDPQGWIARASCASPLIALRARCTARVRTARACTGSPSARSARPRLGQEYVARLFLGVRGSSSGATRAGATAPSTTARTAARDKSTPAILTATRRRRRSLGRVTSGRSAPRTLGVPARLALRDGISTRERAGRSRPHPEAYALLRELGGSARTPFRPLDRDGSRRRRYAAAARISTEAEEEADVGQAGLASSSTCTVQAKSVSALPPRRSPPSADPRWQLAGWQQGKGFRWAPPASLHGGSTTRRCRGSTSRTRRSGRGRYSSRSVGHSESAVDAGSTAALPSR